MEIQEKTFFKLKIEIFLICAETIINIKDKKTL